MGENKIKEARIAAGLTQKQVFELIGIPINTLGNWENGRRNISEWEEKLIVEKILSLKK